MSKTMPTLPRRNAPGRRAAPGFILMAGLILLVVVTLLSMSMFRSFGLQERIAGNTRDKQRSFEAAQSALQYGEWWLAQGTAGTGAACTGVVQGNTVASMRVCSSAISNPQTMSQWSNRIEYVPPNMTVASGGGVASATSDVNYQAKPGIYISYMGLSPDGLSLLYQVTGLGYGGNADTVSVVQSTYRIKSDDTKPLDTP